MMVRTVRPLALLCFGLLASCGGGATGASTTITGGTPRPGGAADLMALVPGSAVVALHANLSVVRGDPAMYDRVASELISELRLSGEATTLRALLDLTDDAVGVFVPAADGSGNDGMLVFSGRYSDSDFQAVLSLASRRHGSTPPASACASGQLFELGNATVAQLDQWTWAIAEGTTLRDHLRQATLGGGRSFQQNLLEFGPRIGLPQGATQAWANQDQQVGIDMVGLVFQGENPQMVHNFVITVMRNLGIAGI